MVLDCCYHRKGRKQGSSEKQDLNDDLKGEKEHGQDICGEEQIEVIARQ